MREVEESKMKKNKKPETEKHETTPVGKMKSSVPKNLKLLQEMQATETMGPSKRNKSLVGRERRLSGPISVSVDKLTMIGQRRSSAGFLEEESSRDKVKKDKYSATHDGYKSVKKMSVANIEYNIMSQDTSKMLVDAEPLKFSGIEPKKTMPKKMRKKLRWRDKSGLEPLVDIREIPADNKGIKCGRGNKELELIDNSKCIVKKSGMNKELELDDVFKTILDWKCVWLEEQKKQKEPPNVQGNRQLITLTETFSSERSTTRSSCP